MDLGLWPGNAGQIQLLPRLTPDKGGFLRTDYIVRSFTSAHYSEKLMNCAFQDRNRLISLELPLLCINFAAKLSFYLWI